MPRMPRKLVPDAPYHVFARGNQRRSVFHDDEDRLWFLQRLWSVEAATGAIHIAHCLMGNHVHLIVLPGLAGLSQLLHRVLGPYSQWFNRRHGQVGHLFQDRFGSKVLDSTEAILWALRYVHRNPVEAGLVSRAEAWRWSSHRDHLRPTVPAYLREGAKMVRGLLSDDPAAAIAELRESVATEAGESRPPMEVAIPDGRHPRDSGQPAESESEATCTPPPLAEIAAEVLRARRLREVRSLSGPSRDPRVRAARRAFCALALRRYHVPAERVAEFLERSPSQVRRLASLAGEAPSATVAGDGVPVVPARSEHLAG